MTGGEILREEEKVKKRFEEEEGKRRIDRGVKNGDRGKKESKGSVFSFFPDRLSLSLCRNYFFSFFFFILSR